MNKWHVGYVYRGELMDESVDATTVFEAIDRFFCIYGYQTIVDIHRLE